MRTQTLKKRINKPTKPEKRPLKPMRRRHKSTTRQRNNKEKINSSRK